MALCAVAAAFPDSDVVASFVSPLTYLVNHRGVTHSLLIMPLWGWLLALLAGLAFRHPRRWRPYWGVAAMGVAAHIAGDLITSYGTIILAPFSDARFAWGTTFIIDLWFSGIILAGLLASLLWKRSAAPAAAACALLVCYVLFQAWLKSEAVDVGVRNAAAAGLSGPDVRVSAQPGPVSPFNWMVVVESNGEYRYALVNLAREHPLPAPTAESGFFYRFSAPYNPPGGLVWGSATLRGAGPDAALVSETWGRSELAFFKWFARYPALYRVDRSSTSSCVWFYDLRFYRPGSDFNPFRYGMCGEAQGGWRRFRLLEDDVRIPFD
jgi:inner membrane protein